MKPKWWRVMSFLNWAMVYFTFMYVTAISFSAFQLLTLIGFMIAFSVKLGDMK